MMEPNERLQRARREKGYESASDAAEAHGWNQNTVISNENGNARFSYKRASEYAKAYGVRVEWLMEGKGPMTAGKIATVPLVGYVGAGAEAHFYGSADAGLGDVAAPDNANDNTRAAEIRGESLGALFEHWLIYFDDVRTPVTPDLIGRLCIVGLPDDRVLVKLLKKASQPHHFHLLSNTEAPILDQEVNWAALVKHMSPR